MEEGKVEASPPPNSGVEKKEGGGGGSETLRGNLVEVAVKFLNNPRVVSSSLEQKTAFLKKKGLTENEIAEAIKLAAASSSATGTSTSPSLLPPPLPPRPPSTPHPLTPPLSWRWRDYAVIAAVMGGVGYALYQLAKRYILPWLKRPREERERLEEISTAVRQLQSNLDTTISTLNETTKAIRDSLSEQQQQMRTIGTQISVLQTSAPGSGLAVREIKEEVASLKGLLLNRHQFPPTPARHSVPGIPSWQRTPQHEQEQKTAAMDSVEEGNREEGGEGGGGGGGGGGGEEEGGDGGGEKNEERGGGRSGEEEEEKERGQGGGGGDSGSQDEQD